MARLNLVVALSFVSTCLAWANAGQEAVPGAIEGIVSADLEDGRTAYVCERETKGDAEIVLTPMLVRGRSGGVSTYIELYLRDVNEGEMGPLLLSIDGKTTRLVIPTDYMRMDVLGETASVTTMIEARRNLMSRIAAAQVMEVEYRADNVSLKATLTPEDKERFQRIVDLDQRGALPPAASLGKEKSDRPRLTGEPEEGASPPDIIKSRRRPPDYPAAARTSHRSGRVKLAIRVLKDGTVSSLRPLEVTPIGIGFTKVALDAVRQWGYKPALKDGQPVDTDFTVVVEWSLSSSPMPR